MRRLKIYQGISIFGALVSIVGIFFLPLNPFSIVFAVLNLLNYVMLCRIEAMYNKHNSKEGE